MRPKASTMSRFNNYTLRLLIFNKLDFWVSETPYDAHEEIKRLRNTSDLESFYRKKANDLSSLLLSEFEIEK